MLRRSRSLCWCAAAHSLTTAVCGIQRPMRQDGLSESIQAKYVVYLPSGLGHQRSTVSTPRTRATTSPLLTILVAAVTSSRPRRHFAAVNKRRGWPDRYSLAKYGVNDRPE